MKLSMLVAGAVGLGLNVALSPAAQAEVTEVVLDIPEGQTKTYTEALKDLGYETYPGNVPLTKTGSGTLKADTFFKDFKVDPITIRDGVLSSTEDNKQLSFGIRPNAIYVKPGATLRFEGSSYPVLSRSIHVSGTGYPGEGGAIHADNSFVQSSANAYILDGDTTFSSDYTAGGTYLLRNGTVYFGRHTLTLTGPSGACAHNVPGSADLKLRGTGCIKVDGAKFAFSSTSSAVSKAADGTIPGYVKLSLVNGACFYSSIADGCSVFDEIEAEPDCTVGCHETVAANTVAPVVKCWKGAPTVKDGITSLTVSDTFTVRVSDLNDGHALTMNGALAFGANAQLEIDGDPNELVATDGKVVIATAEGGVTGLPSLLVTHANRHWKVAAGEDGKSVELVYDSPSRKGRSTHVPFGAFSRARIRRRPTSRNSTRRWRPARTTRRSSSRPATITSARRSRSARRRA